MEGSKAVHPKLENCVLALLESERLTEVKELPQHCPLAAAAAFSLSEHE